MNDAASAQPTGNDSPNNAPYRQRYSQELTILNEIARTLNASVDLPTILERAMEKVAELFGLETGWVLLFDETTAAPYPAAAQNLPQGLVREPDRLTGSCYCLDAFLEGDSTSRQCRDRHLHAPARACPHQRRHRRFTLSCQHPAARLHRR